MEYCDETVTLVRMKLGHKPAVQLGEQIRSSRIIEVPQANKAIEEQAWQIFVKYDDKDYSFTDGLGGARGRRYWRTATSQKSSVWLIVLRGDG